MTAKALKGDWMQTFSGAQFWPLDPRRSAILITDIAHALSLICRFGGHTTRFYSVAEHSILISRAVAPEAALWGLMHDAAEAYVGDMIWPLKASGDNYKYIEVGNEIQRAIADRYRLGPMPDEVKEADNRILVDEHAQVMAPGLTWWTDENYEALGVTIEGLDPVAAEAAFLARFRELYLAAA